MRTSVRSVVMMACGALAFGQSPGTFSATGKMTMSRDAYTATLLANGKVLIAGGENPRGRPGGVLRSAELYDPRTGAFTRTGDVIFPRSYHSATLLPDGRALIAGGTGRYTGSPPLLATAGVYDPETETPMDDMMNPVSNTAILLAKGKVLIAEDGELGTPRVPADSTMLLPAPSRPRAISSVFQAIIRRPSLRARSRFTPNSGRGGRLSSELSSAFGYREGTARIQVSTASIAGRHVVIPVQ